LPGYNVKIMDSEGVELPNGQEGYVVVRLPLPPGCMPTLWKDDERFLEYMEKIPGCYVTGDGGYFDQDGYIFIMGRIDDVINVAGHRLSTGSMEEILSRHRDVAECAVLGVNDQLKGQVPLGFVVLKAGSDRPAEEIEKEVVKMVRDEIGAVASFRQCLVVRALPKTRSGKTLRSTMRKIADGEDYVVPSTIDDASVLISITEAAAKIGYGKK
jgi:propionyl-CoA synthetase